MAVPHNLGADPLMLALRIHYDGARLGALLVLLAAERHRIETGEWPKSVEDLDPGIVEVLPIDPYDEEEYAIVLVEDGVRVYSFGYNREDDDGEIATDYWKTGKGADDASVEAWDVEARGRLPDLATP